MPTVKYISIKGQGCNMATNDYVSISLPQSLIDEIDKVVGTLGYTSRTEFIKDACRRCLGD